MTSLYTLECVPSLLTQWIKRDGRIVGFLYAPHAPGDQWEVWGRQDCADLLPAGLGEHGLSRFPTRDAALAFLGLPSELGRAAA